MKEGEDSRDDFWDIKKLVPKKTTVSSNFSSYPKITEHSISGDVTASEGYKLDKSKIEQDDNAESSTYIPSNEGLIKKVTVIRRADKYDFYESFRNAARLYFDVRSPKCEFVPYYSYMPQYSQLNLGQKNYYFYWRERIRCGEYIKCDYSYIYLFAYEIFNLPEKIPPEEGVLLLCRIWKEYRKALPRIDSYFVVWVQDYCLIHGLECPVGEISDFIFDVIEASSFKEFYLSDMSESTENGINTLLAYLSDYDWRRGKYVAGDHSELYKRHMQGAMSAVLSELIKEHDFTNSKPSILRRDALPHSLCTHTVKCTLEIEYVPLSRNFELRHTVTLAVRYTENKLRALLGIKSRLAVKDLDERYKALIDRYFASLIEKANKRNTVATTPEYEKMYDAPEASVSLEGADIIEKASWNTTLRLIPEEEKLEITEEKAEQNEKIKDKNEENADARYGLSMDDILIIERALTSDISDDSAAERINEAFSEGFGDVILEPCDFGYRLIEDYREDIEEWLKQVR